MVYRRNKILGTSQLYIIYILLVQKEGNKTFDKFMMKHFTQYHKVNNLKEKL